MTTEGTVLSMTSYFIYGKGTILIVFYLHPPIKNYAYIDPSYPFASEVLGGSCTDSSCGLEILEYQGQYLMVLSFHRYCSDDIGER